MDVVRVLLEHGADIEAGDEGGFTTFVMACENNFSDTARFLLERGANINAYDSTLGW